MVTVDELSQLQCVGEQELLFVVGHGLLTVVSSLVEHRFQVHGLQKV